MPSSSSLSSSPGAELEALELGIELGILPRRASTARRQHGCGVGFAPLTSARLREELPPREQAVATINFWYPRSGDDRDGDDADGPEDIEAGAIYSAPILDLFHRRRIGLLLNFGALGFVDGALPMALRSLYTALDASRIDAFLVVVSLCRIFAALSSDLAPTRRFRRRPYLVIGWSVVLTVFAVLTAVECSAAAVPTSHSAVAASHHWIYALAALAVGHQLAAASCDGLLVEYAQREGEDERGCVQLLLIATRVVGALVGRSIVPIRTTDCDVAASTVALPPLASSCSASFLVVFTMGALIALTALVASVIAVDVPFRLVVATPLKDVPRVRDVGRFLSCRVVWQFAAFVTLQAATVTWVAPSPGDLATKLLRLGDMTRWVSDGALLATQLVCASLVLASRRALRWRVVTAVSVVIGSLVVTLPATTLLLQGSTSSLAVFFASHHIAAAFTAIMKLVSLLVVVELARPGLEATSYAILTVLQEVGAVLGVAVADEVRVSWSSPVHHSSDNGFAVPTTAVLLVTRVVFNLVLLPLLPQSKAALRRLRERLTPDPNSTSCTSLCVGRVVVLVLFLAWAAVIASRVHRLVKPRDDVVSTVMSATFLY
ncbi:hypothetical protein PINS_up000877 [Pythium insidiosum]|nr:hypothetical protein PINS_up000877 [Pythium insidiosum]